MIAFRSKLFDAALLLWTSLFAPGIPVLLLCGSPETVIRSATRLWARGTLFALRHIVGLTYVEQGRRPTTRRPYLIISNHQSTWETLAFLAIFPDVAMIAKQELLQIPVFGWYLRRSPMIVVNRESGPKALRTMLEYGEKASAAGRSILLFPEGSRMPATGPVVFRRGAELLYTKLDLPVLPVAVNSGMFWSPFHRHKRPGTITVSHLAPIEPGLMPLDFIRIAEATIEAEVERLTERTRGLGGLSR